MLALCLEGAVNNLRSELAPLALKLELLAARWTKEIRKWTIIGERRNLGAAAVRRLYFLARASSNRYYARWNQAAKNDEKIRT